MRKADFIKKLFALESCTLNLLCLVKVCTGIDKIRRGNLIFMQITRI